MNTRTLTLVALALLAGTALGSSAIAEPQSSIDRALVERLVRAVESNAAATRELVRATERCKR